MPLISSHFHPPLWASNSYLQTIMAHRFKKTRGIVYTRERFFTPDHDFIDLNWAFFKGDKLAILSPGVIGSSRSTYILGMIKILSGIGFDALVWDYRGSGCPNLTRSFYHAGCSEDLDRVIDHVCQTKSYQEIVLIGFSYGGNIVLKYLGEKGKSIKKISKAIAISPPFDLKSTVKELAKFKNWIYNNDILTGIKSRVTAKKKIYPEHFKNIYLEGISSIFDFDRQITAPFNNFSSVEHYYEKCSSKQYISDIYIPTLILTAIDDPILSENCYPIQECKNHSCVALEMPQKGGHIGFVMRTPNGPYYSESRTVDFLTFDTK